MHTDTQGAMNRRCTDPAGLAGRARRLRACTPLAAMSMWVAFVAVGAIWAPLARVAGPLAAMGQTLLATLALHALHEAGHVVTGLLVGAPLQSVTLGVVTVYRERRGEAGRGDGRFRWAVNRSWKRFAGCVERDITPAPGVREALTETALGGPVASLVAGALLLTASDAWAGIGAASLLVGVLNATPVTVLGQASDGMLVWRLWSQRPAHVAWRTEICGEVA